MVARVQVRPQLLLWARDRSQLPSEFFDKNFPQFDDWVAGRKNPTLKQLETFAQRTHTPIGYLFLAAPPSEELAISDFRTLSDEEIANPSPDLLETIGICERRQDWYRDYALRNGFDPVRFVGSVSQDANVTETARAMHRALDLDEAWQRTERSWADTLKTLRETAEDAGLLVMISGIVGSNTHRVLDTDEFRGFALSDPFAPLVFVNGSDTKSAQIFTLVHEVAHIFAGQSGVDNIDLGARNGSPGVAVERWCNQVAAEFLMPRAQLGIIRVSTPEMLTPQLEDLAREYRVSTLVVLRRLFDLGFITAEWFFNAYPVERERVLALSRSERESATGGGGDFYVTQPVRLSRRFTRALITDTLEGGTLHRDAFRLLGLKSSAAFEQLGARVGVA